MMKSLRERITPKTQQLSQNFENVNMKNEVSKSDKNNNSNSKSLINKDELLWDTTTLTVLFLLIGISLFTRLLFINYPSQTVFDEVHFGGFATRYINNEYYFDVHPPLGKMAFAFVAKLGGYIGDFSFEKIGLEYPNLSTYLPMRLLSAFCGIVTVPLVYMILIEMKYSVISACLASSMVLFGNDSFYPKNN